MHLLHVRLKSTWVFQVGSSQSVAASPSKFSGTIGMGVGTGGAEGAAAPPTFGTGELPQKFEPSALRG